MFSGLCPGCINVFLPSTFFLISSCGLKGSYSTLTLPGWLERSISWSGLKFVSGIVSLNRREVRVFVGRTFLLPVVPDLIDESVMKKKLWG